MAAMNTEVPGNIKLSHLDEYKALREEIAMCQHEMHRTWLWATIAAGAVYTWLPSHRSDINSIHFPWLVWSIPPFLLIFCAFRYRIFWFRIRTLADYQYKIEEDAFREGKKDFSTFSVDDFVDLPSLASKLRQTKGPIDTWLAAQLSPATQAALAVYQGSSSDQAPLRAALLQDLSTTVRGSSIYNAQRFHGVNLRSETQDLLSKKPQGNGLLRLNRLLLEDAYPLELSRNELPGIAHCHGECLAPKRARISKFGVAFLWVVLIGWSSFLSWNLSQTKSDDTLSGQVTDSATGRPIVGATVVVTDSSKNPHTVTTDAAGHYVISSLPTGPARVTSKKTGYARASSERAIAPGTNTQDEVLVPKKSPQPAATMPTK